MRDTSGHMVRLLGILGHLPTFTACQLFPELRYCHYGGCRALCEFGLLLNVCCGSPHDGLPGQAGHAQAPQLKVPLVTRTCGVGVGAAFLNFRRPVPTAKRTLVRHMCIARKQRQHLAKTAPYHCSDATITAVRKHRTYQRTKKKQTVSRSVQSVLAEPPQLPTSLPKEPPQPAPRWTGRSRGLVSVVTHSPHSRRRTAENVNLRCRILVASLPSENTALMITNCQS